MSEIPEDAWKRQRDRKVLDRLLRNKPAWQQRQDAIEAHLQSKNPQPPYPDPETEPPKRLQ